MLRVYNTFQISIIRNSFFMYTIYVCIINLLHHGNIVRTIFYTNNVVL